MSTTTKQPGVKAKIYHLVNKGSNSSAEIYTRVDKFTRVKSQDQPNERPFLQITFADENGQNKTIRFKLNCPTFDLHEQIEKYKIPANAKYTDAERNALIFSQGVLYTKSKAAQEFLDQHPQNSNFKGDCPDIKGPMFVEYDPVVVRQNERSAFKRRLEAYKKVESLNQEAAEALFIKLFGVSARIPAEPDEIVLQIVDFLDNSDDSALEAVLSEGKTLLEDATILVGLATQKGVISFEEPEMKNFVVKKKHGKVIPLKEISAELPLSERRRFFAEFLTSKEGNLTYKDIKSELESLKEDAPEKNAAQGKKEDAKAEAKTGSKKEAAEAV